MIDAMKLILTLLARDEEDIIRENILFHLNHGVDFIIATNNDSVDGTADIFNEFEKQGVLKSIYEPGNDHSQWRWVTKMARLAAEKYKADWVINSDADEFWYPAGSDLKGALQNVADEISVLEVDRHDFVPVDDIDKPFYERMIYRKKVSLNSLGEPLPPKVIHRAMPDVVMFQGNHKLIAPENLKKQKAINIEILHFPIRTYAQYQEKIVWGSQAVERNLELGKGICRTWRVLYQKYLEGGFEDYYRSIEYSPERIASELETGDIILDKRLQVLIPGLLNN
jgi:hypothetical protein